jgi:hypothetical protein
MIQSSPELHYNVVIFWLKDLLWVCQRAAIPGQVENVVIT